jgi:putative SOS response-associated peptidase YedK
MCNRYALHYQHWQDYCELMNTEMPTDWRIRWPSGGWVAASNEPWPENVFPRRPGLFLRPAVEGGLEPVLGQWGLVSPAEKGPLKAVKFAPNNARSEAVDKTFPFRFVMANRALIPMSNFVEWTGPKGSMTLHEIGAADGAMLLAAGLWSQAETADGPVTSYTMLMQDTRDGDDCQPFHNRQPVILEHDDAMTWLGPAQDYRPLLRSPACGSLVIDPPEPASSNAAMPLASVDSAGLF